MRTERPVGNSKNPWRKGMASSISIALVLGGAYLVVRPTVRAKEPLAPAASTEFPGAPRAPTKELYRATLPSPQPRKANDPPSKARATRAARASTPATSKTSLLARQYLAKSWVESVINYDGANRGELLDGILHSMVREGAPLVFDLQHLLGETSVYQSPARAAIFHALGRIGARLTGSAEPEAIRALEAIHRIADDELALPTYIPPDPELRIDELPPGQRAALLHHGTLTEKDGKLVQPTLLNKLPVIRMLRAVGNEESMKQLQALKETDNLAGVQFAVEQAFAVAVP